MARLPPPPSTNFFAHRGSVAPPQIRPLGDINELSGPVITSFGSELSRNGSTLGADPRSRSSVDANAPKWLQKRQMRQQGRQQGGQPDQLPQNGRTAFSTQVINETPPTHQPHAQPQFFAAESNPPVQPPNFHPQQVPLLNSSSRVANQLNDHPTQHHQLLAHDSPHTTPAALMSRHDPTNQTRPHIEPAPLSAEPFPNSLDFFEQEAPEGRGHSRTNSQTQPPQESAVRSPYSYFEDSISQSPNEFINQHPAEMQGHQEYLQPQAPSKLSENHISSEPYKYFEEDPPELPKVTPAQITDRHEPTQYHASAPSHLPNIANVSSLTPSAPVTSYHSLDKYFDAPPQNSTMPPRSNSLTTAQSTPNVQPITALPDDSSSHLLASNGTFDKFSELHGSGFSEISQISAESDLQMPQSHSDLVDFQAGQSSETSQLPSHNAREDPSSFVHDQSEESSSQLLGELQNGEGQNLNVQHAAQVHAEASAASSSQTFELGNDQATEQAEKQERERQEQELYQELLREREREFQEHQTRDVERQEKSRRDSIGRRDSLGSSDRRNSFGGVSLATQRRPSIDAGLGLAPQRRPSVDAGLGLAPQRRSSIDAGLGLAPQRRPSIDTGLGAPQRRSSIDAGLGAPQRRSSIDASAELLLSSEAPTRRPSIDLPHLPEQAPNRNSKWAQRAALRKQTQGTHSRQASLQSALSEMSTAVLGSAGEVPAKSSLLEPPASLLPDAPSPTGVAVEALPIAPHETPYNTTSSYTLPPSNVLPPLRSQAPSTVPSQSGILAASTLSTSQPRRLSLSHADSQPRRLSQPNLDPLATTQLHSLDGDPTHHETKTSKKKIIRPLPPSFDYCLLTPEIVKERLRKRNYPIPFPIFCAMWTKFDTVLVGGGGGQPGTGVSSGALVCEIKKEHPDPRSQRYDNGWSVIPQAEVDTCDYIFYKMAHHPTLNEIVGAVGPRVYRFFVNGRILESNNFAQTDFSLEIINQLTSCVRFSRDGQRFATGGEDRRVRVWSYPDLQLAKSLGAHSSGVVSVDFSSDGRRVASASGEKKHSCIRVWDVEQGGDRREGGTDDQGLVKEIRHKLGKNEMEFSGCQWGLEGPSECLLAILNATARGPGYLGKFDATSFKLLKLQKIDPCPLGNMEISPNRQHVVLANNEGRLWVFDVKSFKCLNSQKDCHDLPCTSLTWSPDGTMICSASADKSIVFLPRQGPPPKSSCTSYLLLWFHVVVVLLIYLVLCPDPSRPWALIKEEL